jgi:hypothetical protein
VIPPCPSFTDTPNESAPEKLAAGRYVNEPVAARVNVPCAGLLVLANVSESPLASVAVTVDARSRSSVAANVVTRNVGAVFDGLLPPLLLPLPPPPPQPESKAQATAPIDVSLSIMFT